MFMLRVAAGAERCGLWDGECMGVNYAGDTQVSASKPKYLGWSTPCAGATGARCLRASVV